MAKPAKHGNKWRIRWLDERDHRRSAIFDEYPHRPDRGIVRAMTTTNGNARGTHSSPPSDAQTAGDRVVTSELCVVGAGIAALNAIFAASRHLSSRDRIVLVDRAHRAGGMWVEAYDYVRLHQPHRMFTVGNLQWSLGKEPSYLASRSEVLGHLESCLATLRNRVTIEDHYGYSYDSHEERADDVLVRFSAVHAGSPGLVVKTKKLVKAFGSGIQMLDPLPLSSSSVRSVSPSGDLLGDEMRASSAPIYVAGGGKTGMDTAHALVTRFPGRKVHLLIGKGTLFTSRDLTFPGGLGRWFGGTTTLEAFIDLAARFDGTNEEEVLRHFRANYTVSLDNQCRGYMFGVLSTEENAVIKKGVAEILRDYLVDVVDRDGQPTMILRSGESRPIEPGSVIVNCTGHIGRRHLPYEPFVSTGGKVLSIQPTSIVHLLSSLGAYFNTHLLYLNQLSKLPLYEVDFPEMNSKAKDALFAVMMTHLLYNAALILEAVPTKVRDECGLDLERWYPLPRRLVAVISLVRYLKRHPDHHRRTLDRVRDRFGVRCGTLAHFAA